MNVTELARRLRIHPKKMLEVLPRHGFDVGAKAVKIDDRVANQIMREWRRIKRILDEEEHRALEEKKRKERELRREQGHRVTLSERMTVRIFAERLAMPVTQVMTELMRNGILANQNQDIDFETAAILAEDLGFVVEKEKGESIDVNKESARASVLEDALGRGVAKTSRPPVIVVMGHVDHGKTKLLDAIRKTNVMATESGGITQHIGAYQTKWKDPKSGDERKLTFIDTPGHEAFTSMRSRGAKVADVAILVVAADDGVKPQTEEVIQIIRAAKLPFVVAINKVDKDTADVQRVKTELSQHNIISEEWGGTVPMVEISAKLGLSIDKLLDVILLVADMQATAIQADATIPAVGTIIESHVDKGTGPVATVLVQAGTLRAGDPLVVNGELYGKVRAMRDDYGREMTLAGPSTPAQIIGFKVAPEVGDILNVAQAGEAKRINTREKRSQQTSAERYTITQTAPENEEEKGKKTVNVLIKADVLGSLEAIIGSLEKILHDEVGVKIIGKGLGNITDDDVGKAEAGAATIVGFHVQANPLADASMRDKGVEFLRFEVIYDLIDWVKAQLEKLLDKEKIITEVGRCKVLAVFRRDKGAMTIGGRVEDGKARKDVLARVKRGGEIVGVGKIVSCHLGKQEVKEVTTGTECGLRFEGKMRVEEGDVLEFYTEESKARKIVFQ